MIKCPNYNPQRAATAEEGLPCVASAIIVRCHIKDSPDDRRLSLVRMIPDTQRTRDFLALLQAHHINSGFSAREARNRSTIGQQNW